MERDASKCSANATEGTGCGLSTFSGAKKPAPWGNRKLSHKETEKEQQTAIKFACQWSVILTMF